MTSSHSSFQHLKSITLDYLARLSNIFKQLEAIHLPTAITESPFHHNNPSTFSEHVDATAFNDAITSLHQQQQSLTQAVYSSKNLLRCLRILVNNYPSPSIYELLDEYLNVEEWLNSFKHLIQPNINAHLVSVDIHWSQLIDADSDANLTQQEISILISDVDELASIVNESESTLSDAELVQSRSDDVLGRYEEWRGKLELRLRELGDLDDTISQCQVLQADIEAYVDELAAKLQVILKDADALMAKYAGYLQINESLNVEFTRQLSISKEIERIRNEADTRIRQLQHFNEAKEEEFWSRRSDQLPLKLIQAFRGV